MDPGVWKHLVDHEDILRQIFSRFSWDTNLRLRSVSKAFHATLSEPSFLTWSSMLNDRSFHAEEWVDSSSTDTEHMKQRHADPVCLFSTSPTYVVFHSELQRWCKLPPVGHLPFGDLKDFTVAGVADGLFLLERKPKLLRKYTSVDLYELDRFLFNPLTEWFMKLPPVPRWIQDDQWTRFHLQDPVLMAVDKEKSITVVAMEICVEDNNPYFDSSSITKIFIWRPSDEDWKPLFIPKISDISWLGAVFAGGELFLYTVEHPRRSNSGNPWHKIISYKGCDIDREKIYDVPLFHLFEHRGVLKRLIGTGPPGIDEYYSVNLCTFDHMNRSWQEHDMIDLDMPKDMLKKLYDTVPGRILPDFFVDVVEDTLCIGNRLKAEIVLFLYNFERNQWSELVIANTELNDRKIFLWSPKQSFT